MAWIESHQELAQHPKTKRLARALGVSVPTAIGHLHLFWWWALSYALDGDISEIDDEDVADAAMWEDEPEAFVEALRRAGFVDDAGQIHDWDEYSGKWQERRNANAARVRAHRERTRNAHVRVTKPLGKGATGPNLTGPNLTGGQYSSNIVAVDARDDGGADAPTVTTAAATKAQGPKVGYLALSGAARFVVDDWREQQGRKRPPKLNPAQCAEIELAVAELGTQRLIEANAWAARNAVPEIVKAIRAARTKRQRDEDEAADQERAQPPTVADGGVAGESLAPPTDEEQAVWQAAREALTAEMSRPNWETYIAPLTLAGRGADGGLRLRAPPGLGDALRRFRGVIVRSLDDAGDPRATRVAIVEARPGRE